MPTNFEMFLSMNDLHRDDVLEKLRFACSGVSPRFERSSLRWEGSSRWVGYFPRKAIARLLVMKAPHGFSTRNGVHWSLGFAWWTDASGRVHTRSHGWRGDMGMQNFPRRFTTGTGINIAENMRRISRKAAASVHPYRWVYPTLTLLLGYGFHWPDWPEALSTGFGDAIENAPNDLIPWLLAADWLEENGHGGADTIREFFDY
jgi:uncharacterized protein (TIGR02996 family)